MVLDIWILIKFSCSTSAKLFHEVMPCIFKIMSHIFSKVMSHVFSEFCYIWEVLPSTCSQWGVTTWLKIYNLDQTSTTKTLHAASLSPGTKRTKEANWGELKCIRFYFVFEIKKCHKDFSKNGFSFYCLCLQIMRIFIYRIWFSLQKVLTLIKP